MRPVAELTARARGSSPVSIACESVSALTRGTIRDTTATNATRVRQRRKSVRMEPPPTSPQACERPGGALGGASMDVPGPLHGDFRHKLYSKIHNRLTC